MAVTASNSFDVFHLIKVAVCYKNGAMRTDTIQIECIL